MLRRTPLFNVARLGARVLRALLVRYVRSGPQADPTQKRVVVLLVSAWGMGGTIRAALNMCGYLADHEQVEILSVYRRKDEPFFGAFPPGVKATALNDSRPGHQPKGPAGIAYKLLSRVPSVLVNGADRSAHEFSLWVDIQLVRNLRGGGGILMGTRPGLNLICGLLDPPGYITIGLEQMHLRHHVKPLRAAMPRLYPKLDAFVALTEQDVDAYRAHLNGGVKLFRIPNTVRDMPGPKADLSKKIVFAAGRLREQKGFDYLIPAWGPIARKHPDWKLRICGTGRERGKLERLIAEHDVAESVSLEGPAADIGTDMANASIFALSSRYEGFPLILLEAMSKGMAVVAFDCPTGPADIIDNRENGIIVALKDVEALTAGLLEMIESEELRRHCAPNAIATAEQFKMPAIGPMWDELFAQLRAERAAAGSSA
jgi:glycosyltransferase involved in cell wall biosynthesis